MKKALSLVFVFVLLLGMVSIKIFAIDNDINPWEDRNAVFVGDSITAGSGTTKIYFEYLAERLGLSSVTPMGPFECPNEVYEHCNLAARAGAQA